MKKNEFWDSKFNAVKTNWGFVPSDSAIRAKDFFISNKVKDILIPGIGYGRNARIFLESGINVEGIEISKVAIDMAKSGIQPEINIYHGSVTDMPFSSRSYDGIFCYALIHLLNKYERKRFIHNCYNQLRTNASMIFTVISKKSDMYGNGRLLSTDRYQIMKGLDVFFYDNESVIKEFNNFGLIDFNEIDEPVKHMENEPPLKCIYIRCRKEA